MNIIETKRLLIRRFTAADWQDLYEYLSDEEVLRYEPYEPLTERECKRETVRRSEDRSYLAVCLKDTGKLIGHLYFSEQKHNTWSLGFVFNKTYWQQGYGSEAAEALLSYAFGVLGARRIVSECNPDNEGSWKLLEKIHMRREGHLRKNIYFKRDENGEPIWWDTYLYAVLREEWVYMGKDILFP